MVSRREFIPQPYKNLSPLVSALGLWALVFAFVFIVQHVSAEEMKGRTFVGAVAMAMVLNVFRVGIKLVRSFIVSYEKQSQTVRGVASFFIAHVLVWAAAHFMILLIYYRKDA